MVENELAHRAIGLAIDLHKETGPGLLESTYKECMRSLLVDSGVYVEAEKLPPIIFRGKKLEVGYRVDLLVENKLVIEVKRVEALNDIHIAQVLTYLHVGNFKLGLLLNSNVVLMKDGIRRLINGRL